MRGEIWLVALDPTRGSEIQKTRPCLVVSPPDLATRFRTLIVCPLTTGSHPAPFRVPIDFGSRSGLVLPEQIRTVDKARLIRKLGIAPSLALAETLAILRDMFADE